MTTEYRSSHIVTHEDIIVGSYWIAYSSYGSIEILYKVVEVNHKYATLYRISRRTTNWNDEYDYMDFVFVADLNEPLEVLLERYELISRAEVVIHW